MIISFLFLELEVFILYSNRTEHGILIWTVQNYSCVAGSRYSNLKALFQSRFCIHRRLTFHQNNTSIIYH